MTDTTLFTDNQSLFYSLLNIQKAVPTIATIHHPITVDRKLDIRRRPFPLEAAKQVRWYSFIGTQIKVSRKLL